MKRLASNALLASLALFSASSMAQAASVLPQPGTLLVFKKPIHVEAESSTAGVAWIDEPNGEFLVTLYCGLALADWVKAARSFLPQTAYALDSVEAWSVPSEQLETPRQEGFIAQVSPASSSVVPAHERVTTFICFKESHPEWLPANPYLGEAELKLLAAGAFEL